jgi:hypothetical protein
MYNVNNINTYFELSNMFNMHTQKVVYAIRTILVAQNPRYKKITKIRI